MSRGAQSFRERDLIKAIKAALKAGLSVKSFEVADGKITVIAGRPEDREVVNEWDSVK